MLRQLSIRSRLSILVITPLLALVAVLFITFGQMATIEQGVNSLYQDRIVPLKQIKATSDQYGIAIVDLFHKYRGGQQSRQQLTDAIGGARQKAEQEWQSYKQTQLTPEEERLIADADHHFSTASALTDRYLQMSRDGRFRQLDNSVFIDQLYAAFDPLTAALDKLIQLQLSVSADFVVESDKNFAQLMTRMMVMAIILLAALSLMGFMMYRSIERPLTELNNSFTEIADQSDLTRRVSEDGRDEITSLSRSFNHMLGRFQTVIVNLRDAVHQSSAAAEEMSAISQQVSTTVSGQEEQVSMVAAAITEMSGAVQEVANSASDTSAQATSADQQARAGLGKVQDNVHAINTLSTSVQQASAVINRLHEQSGEITEVLTVIRNIAEQTNLLALNAAIESARAGEAGRGFAVVADEVRKLAQNTQQATTSISDMIDQLQGSAREAVTTMDQARQEASDSVGYATAAGELLENIVTAVSRIAEMNFQVSTATEEQAQVANEIHNNVSQFSIGLSEVSESAAQSALASEEIARLSGGLQDQVSTFRA